MLPERYDNLQIDIEPFSLQVVMSACQWNEWNPTPMMFFLTVSIYIISINTGTASLCLLQ